MTASKCDICRGHGGPIEIECPECAGTGYDPTDDKPFAQCHTCHGDQTIEVEECINCGGIGEVDANEF